MLETVSNNANADHKFFGRGKLLITGEYFVLDGAKSLAIPTHLGQSLDVSYTRSYSPKLHWKAYNYDGEVWIEAAFDLWRFDLIEDQSYEQKGNFEFLQKLLRAAREINPHFLREENMNVLVETKLGFPKNWGLGSSSTLIYNIAQWAYVSPFELHFKCYGGSGYDVACARSEGPIHFEKQDQEVSWELVDFLPMFSDKLAFIYLGQKMSSATAIEHYKSKRPIPETLLNKISELTEQISKCHDFSEFERLILTHEEIVSSHLNLPRVQDERFQDFNGVVKSLGAWGGDFALVTCREGLKTAASYFQEKGIETFIPYHELVLSHSQKDQLS